MSKVSMRSIIKGTLGSVSAGIISVSKKHFRLIAETYKDEFDAGYACAGLRKSFPDFTFEVVRSQRLLDLEERIRSEKSHPFFFS